MLSQILVALVLCQTVFGLTGSISTPSAKYSIGDTVPLNGTLQFDFQLEKEYKHVALQFSAGGVSFTQWPVSSGNGDYRLKLAVGKLPAYLRSFASIDAELVVGDAKQIHPVATITPVVRAEVPEVVRFGKKREIYHMFRHDAKEVPKAIAQTFVVLVVVLLGLLFSAWARFGAFSATPAGAAEALKATWPLLVPILACEVSFVRYFAGASIFTTLATWAVVLPVGVYFGIRSLRFLAARRKAGKR